MSIFVSCGEVSGDLYAAGLIRELLNPELFREPALSGALPEPSEKIWGMLGPRGVAAGGAAVWSYEELKLMGFMEVLPAIPRILRLRGRVVNEILRRRPAAAVVIDSPDFHISLAKKLRKAGYRGLIVFLVTPTVWAWRGGRTKWLRDVFDLCLPLFSFEHDFLIARGVRSRWAAHPLVEALAGCKAPPELESRYRGERVIALMAGSRRYDIKNHLAQLLETAKLLRSERPGPGSGSGKTLLPVFSVAPGLSEPLRREVLERTAGLGFESWDGEGRELMALSEAVAGVSGTVAVEAMLLRRFMVVIYNVRGLAWLITRALVRTPYISIPNCLSGAPLFPELLNEPRPERIVRELHAYLDDPSRKAETDRRMETAKNAMGSTRAAAFWARAIIDELRRRIPGPEAPEPRTPPYSRTLKEEQNS
ncbi:MAG: lipid-A-disaccharide synthase [Synergistaceae bacterium]|jgi:lipid-A-disaccharide synthase|nr:lipid-A-disaccharide synthase [Synergistaceae bacterium]